jgi:hypothetical protein
MKNRTIVDGIISLHELLPHTHVKKQIGVVLKLDFKKAFDKVNWDFLLDSQRAMSFGDFWCNKVEKILQNGTVSVKINNVIGPYFQSSKGFVKVTPFLCFSLTPRHNALPRWCLRLKIIISLLV